MKDGGANRFDPAGEIMARIDQLAQISESPGALTRRYLTAEHRRANDLVAGWMRQAGMAVREDAAGNLVGRYEGQTPDSPALMLGSHLDTVVDAGRFDGMLGVVVAIACVGELARRERRLPFAVEVVAFGDEEGARFSAALLGSKAVAGSFGADLLQRRDDAGVTIAQAMTDFGLDPDRICEAARRPQDIVAYVEAHIEQGPLLEDAALPVGVVTSIAGATRLMATIEGSPGHAGTVPMTVRQDALAGAAEAVLAVEDVCSGAGGIVGTVGQLHVEPGAVNVIPGRVSFSIDVRSPDDERRRAAVEAAVGRLRTIGDTRNLKVDVQTVHETSSTPCAVDVIRGLEEAASVIGLTLPRLASGAGHDAVAMAGITPVGMLFVRCAGGISHNPAEFVEESDAALAAEILLHFIERLARSTGGDTGVRTP